MESPLVWRTSKELIKQSPASFHRLDQVGIDAVLERLPHSMIADYLREYPDTPVRLHKGDLTIDGSFANTHALVVDGNLTIRGSYDDYHGNIGMLIVFGDLCAEHVVSWGSIAVTGRLEATGLVYAYYNDFTFEVDGVVKAQALIVSDKSGSYPHVDAAIVQTDDRDDTALALRHFVPEVMIKRILEAAEDEDRDTSTLRVVASYGAVAQRVAAGEPIFREQPGPTSLAADLRRLFAPKVAAATMTRLARADRLLAMVVASKESVPIELQRQFAESGDAAILERLAANPKADPVVLARIADTNAAVAAHVARNPNAPPEVQASLAANSDPAVRIALLERPTLDVAALSRLAAADEVELRERLTRRPHAQRLPPDAVARLVADPEAAVRVNLPYHDALLNIEQLAVLARDKSPEVREAVAVALKRQTLWQQVPAGTPEARGALIATLLDDPVPAVRLAALPGASPGEQEQFVATLTGDERSRVEAELAEFTRSVPLMTRAANGEHAAAEALARNLAITPALQQRLIDRLPAPAPRPPEVDPDSEEPVDEGVASWDGVIEALVQNPNATPEILIAIARYCRASTAPQELCKLKFCRLLLERKDLAADVLEIVDDVIDSMYWAPAVLASPYSTRAQIERAGPRSWYYMEPKIVVAFGKLRSRQGGAWWDALAASKQPKLREVAAVNAATSPATLVTLLRDPDSDVSGRAASNPSTPIDALAAVHAGSSWIVAHPRIPDTVVRHLLDRALLENDDTAIEACKKVLAARALRAAG